jgi:hypothetical protein
MVVRTLLAQVESDDAELPHDACHPLVIDPLAAVPEFGGDARGPVGAVRFLVDLGDPLGELGIDPSPVGPRFRAGQVPVEAGSGDLQDPAQPLDAEGATVIVDELEAAAHQLVSAAKYFAALRRISRSSSSSFTRARSCRFSFSIAVASTAPGRAACSVSRTHVRSVSWLMPRSLATDAYVPPGLAWYSATASARNSGEYFDVPNGNSCPMDLHDPMIRVSTIKG